MHSNCFLDSVVNLLVRQMGLVIQIFNGSYDAGVDVVFPHSCP